MKGILMKIFVISFFLVVGVLNVGYIIFEKCIPDKGFEQAFQSGKFDVPNDLILCACFVLLSEIVVMLFMILLKNFRLGLALLLCFGASVCSAVVVGFSSSIYASGQRIFFFSEFFMLIASAVMFNALGFETDRQRIKKLVLVVALISLAINALSWIFLETPIMG